MSTIDEICMVFTNWECYHKNMWIYDFLFAVQQIFARGHVRLWKMIKSSVYKFLYKQPTLLL